MGVKSSPCSYLRKESQVQSKYKSPEVGMLLICLKNKIGGAAEMTQQLRAHTALVEELNSVPISCGS